MHGAPSTFEKECIGPVPAEDTLTTDLPKDSLAAFFTTPTNGSEICVLDAASPWIILTCTSPKPLSFKCFLSLESCLIGSILGTSLKSIFTSALDGRTVLAPGPSHPDENPAMLHVGLPTIAFLISSPFLPPTNRFMPYSFLNDFSSNGSLAITPISSRVNLSASLYQSLTRILPLSSRSVFKASTMRQAGFSMRTARLEWASRTDSFMDSSTYKSPFIPRLMTGLSFSSTYPNSQITPSHENFLLYFLRYLSMCMLPTSSSPSTRNFMLHGTSPVVRRIASTALILVMSSPLSSADPRP